MRPIIALIVLLLSVPANAAISCFASAKCAGTACTTPAINTTGATLFVVGTATITAGGSLITTTSPTNSAFSNTSNTGAGASIVHISYLVSPNTGASQTFTFSGSATSGVAYACSGTATSSVLGATAIQGTGQTSPFQIGSVAYTAGDLVFTVIGSNGSTITSDSIDSGFQTPVDNRSGVNEISATSYLVTTTGTSVNPTWTTSGNTDWHGVNAVFKQLTSVAGVARGGSWF